jgi:glycosidase
MLNLLGSHDTPRILTRLGGDAARLRIALTFLMTIPGAPLVYYGDEVGMLGGHDPDCRRPMSWSPEDWHDHVLRSHRLLIALRQEHAACRHGEIDSLATFNGAYAYRRAWSDDEIIVVLNPREGIADFEVPTHSSLTEWRELYSGATWSTQNGVLRMPLVPARSAQVFIPR